jgi:hypothetical protein
MDLRAIIAAALYDFAGQLTTRKEPITAGATHDAAPMAEAVSQFLKLREVDVRRDPPIKTWQSDLRVAQLDEDNGAMARTPLCFREELERVIKKWGQDITYGMPDYVLAKLVIDVLDAHGKADLASRLHRAETAPGLFMKEEALAGATVTLNLAFEPHAGQLTSGLLNQGGGWPFPTDESH